MTKEQYILQKEYERLVSRIGEVDPLINPQTYKTLLECIDGLYALSGSELVDVSELMDVGAEKEPDPIPEMEEPSVEEFKPPVMNVVKPEPETPVHSFTKEEVRAALARARKNGTNVVELLGEFGYDNFSAVPAGTYPELMARLGES